jgi:TatD DNase family protein
MTQQQNRPGDAVSLPAFVDTHCHLDDEAFAADLIKVLERSNGLGVGRCINVGFNPDRWESTIDLAARFGGISCMLGMHPGDADRWTADTHQLLSAHIARSHAVAIGEIGLDFYRGETNIDQQVAVFNAQLDLALAHDLPAVIHMRDAEEMVLGVLGGRRETPALVFHSFDGTTDLTDWILANNAAVGVGGLATRTKATQVQRQLKRIPLNRMLLETDSPYLVPNGFKHRRNTPESIPRVASFLAGLLGTDEAHIAIETTRNAERIFERLPPA